MSPPILPTPAEMIAHLDRFVRGQARAKQDNIQANLHYLDDSRLKKESEGS